MFERVPAAAATEADTEAYELHVRACALEAAGEAMQVRVHEFMYACMCVRHVLTHGGTPGRYGWGLPSGERRAMPSPQLPPNHAPPTANSGSCCRRFHSSSEQRGFRRSSRKRTASREHGRGGAAVERGGCKARVWLVAGGGVKALPITHSEYPRWSSRRGALGWQSSFPSEVCSVCVGNKQGLQWQVQRLERLQEERIIAHLRKLSRCRDQRA